MSVDGHSALLDALDSLLSKRQVPARDTRRILLLGTIPVELAPALWERARSVTVWHSDPAYGSRMQLSLPDVVLRDVDLACPWSVPPTAFDVVVAAIGPKQLTKPLVDYLAQLAPRLVIDAGGHQELCLARSSVRKFGFLVKEHGTILTACQPSGQVVPRRPLLVHVHIPKTAGISFNKVLEGSFGERHLNCYVPEPHVYTAEALGEVLFDRPDLVSISSHSFRRFPSILADRIPLYTCFLRRPLERLISNMAFIKKNFAIFPDIIKREYPSNAHELSIRQLMRWCLDRQGDLNRLGMATHYLAEAEWDAATCAIYPVANRAPSASEALRRCYDELAYELAQQILERFCFVGLTEQAAESVDILNRLLRGYGLNLTVPMGRENVSHDVVGDTSWLTADDEVGGRALAYAEIDEPLYQYGLGRMERQRIQAASFF